MQCNLGLAPRSPHQVLSTTTLTGLGKEKYVIPLHILPVVPGHSVKRLSLRETETTVNSVEVVITCNRCYN